MKIEVHVTHRPIPRPCRVPTLMNAGALAEFYGMVREEENGGKIRGLFYEGYLPMAQKVMAAIAHELAGEYAVQAVTAVHRLGEIPVGEAAIYVGCMATHRQEAFMVVTSLMDRLKQEVPIWKAGVLR